MRRLNVIAVFDPSQENMLVCLRKKDPYKGLYNLVGGKVEDNENSDDAAYRELLEETGIQKEEIVLHHFMDFCYYSSNFILEVYVGKLQHPVELKEEVNALYWKSCDSNFFDPTEFAGDGNLGHILALIKKSKILENK